MVEKASDKSGVVYEGQKETPVEFLQNWGDRLESEGPVLKPELFAGLVEQCKNSTEEEREQATRQMSLYMLKSPNSDTLSAKDIVYLEAEVANEQQLPPAKESTLAKAKEILQRFNVPDNDGALAEKLARMAENETRQPTQQPSADETADQTLQPSPDLTADNNIFALTL
jgi:hypothetical protein